MCQQLVACAAALLQTDTHLCGRSTADNAVRPQRSEFVRISRLIAGFKELEQNINVTTTCMTGNISSATRKPQNFQPWRPMYSPCP